MNRFGQSCLLARRLIEAGVRFVTVNMFETVFDEITWDIHGSRPFSPISCYRDLVGPMFDMAYSSLLEELHDRAAARRHDGGGHGRIRPHAEGESRGRTRSLAAMLDRADGRRRSQGRAGGRSVGRHRRRSQGPADDAGRDRRDCVSMVWESISKLELPGAQRPADPAGGSRRGTDQGVVRHELSRNSRCLAFMRVRCFAPRTR